MQVTALGMSLVTVAELLNVTEVEPREPNITMEQPYGMLGLVTGSQYRSSG